MTLVVEATLLAVSTAVAGSELGAEGAIEGRIPDLIPDAEEVVLGVAMNAPHPRERPKSEGLTHGETSILKMVKKQVGV